MSEVIPVDAENLALASLSETVRLNPELGGYTALLELLKELDSVMSSGSVVIDTTDTSASTIAAEPIETPWQRRARLEREEERYWEEYVRQRGFFVAAFKEAKWTPWEGRTVRGPLHQGLNSILGRCSELLHAVEQAYRRSC